MFKDEFGGGDREVLGAILMKDLDIGATEKEVISNNHFWGDKMKEGIDGEVNNSERIVVIQIMPLEVVIGTSEEGRGGISLADSREGLVIGLMN